LSALFYLGYSYHSVSRFECTFYTLIGEEIAVRIGLVAFLLHTAFAQSRFIHGSNFCTEAICVFFGRDKNHYSTLILKGTQTLRLCGFFTFFAQCGHKIYLSFTFYLVVSAIG